MCTINITIDDALLERIRPAFRSEDALRSWMTERVKSMLQDYNDALTTVPCSYTDEEMYSLVKNRVWNLENRKAELIDGDECLSGIRTRYGIKA